MSAAGDALQTLPASVARFRIWTEPTTAAASTSAGKCAAHPLVGGDVRHHRRRRRSSGAVGVADRAVELGDPLDVDDDATAGRSRRGGG